MKKVKLNKKSKTITMTVTSSMFKTKNKKLENAAKEIVKEIGEHFQKEGKKAWPLGASYYITEIFSRAFGHHLENYLFRELFKSKKYTLKSGKNGGLVIDRVKTKR